MAKIWFPCLLQVEMFYSYWLCIWMTLAFMQFLLYIHTRSRWHGALVQIMPVCICILSCMSNITLEAMRSVETKTKVFWHHSIALQVIWYFRFSVVLIISHYFHMNSQRCVGHNLWGTRLVLRNTFTVCEQLKYPSGVCKQSQMHVQFFVYRSHNISVRLVPVKKHLKETSSIVCL